MKIKTRTTGKTLIVELTGEFDLVMSEEFRQRVDGCLDKGGIVNLLLDMRKVSFIDSSGLGAIIGRYKIINRGKGNMAIVGAGPQITKVLEFSGIKRIIDIYENERSALADLT
ncbi:MAG: anti-sigma factor antagonist [Clostridia bacterium]|nr:anti-sigma factor antagonist [Clostridia bacterium]